MIRIKGLSFGYNLRELLLRNISISLQDGDSLCILGPNGTGKTTLIKCLLGIYKVPSGTIELGGLDMTKMTARQLAQYVAYVPQAAHLDISYRVIDVVLMGRNPYIGFVAAPSKQDYACAWQSLEQLGIANLAEQSFGQLSGGQKQMVLIARAVAQQSRIMILDEPTASLDYGNQVRILKLIQGLVHNGQTIVMTSHVPEHAFWICNRVALLKHGTIFTEGNPDQVLSEKNLSELYETEVRIVHTSRVRDVPKRQVCVTLPLL